MTQPTNVTRLFRGPPADAAMDDIPLGRRLRAPPIIAAPTKPALDLSGKPKIMLVVGPGNAGKTTFLRWAADVALQRDPDCTAIFSAVGDKRDLARYVPYISQPDEFEPEQETAGNTQWLAALFMHCMKERVSAAIDFDAGDKTVESLVLQHEDLVGMVEQAGVALVVVYLLTPRVDDLSTLATLEWAGFQSPTTLVVLNGFSDPTVSVDTKFAPLMGHEAFKSIVKRGAVVVRMPRLHAAAAVEARRLGFIEARDGIGEKTPLNVWDRSRVNKWLNDMDEAFAPVQTWLP